MKLFKAAAAGMLLCSAGVSQAAQPVFGVRLGLTEGGYQSKSAITVNGDSVVQSNDSWFFSYGVQTGLSVAIASFFGDLAVEYYSPQVDNAELDRTDVLATLGYLIDEHWSVFAGYRDGSQGDGPFDDNTFQESGWYLGAGFGGMDMGSLVFGTSLAYNLSNAEIPNAIGEFDYDGLSLKLSLSPKAAPQHSFQLRYQRFDGDGSKLFEDIDGDGTVDNTTVGVDLTESYLQFTYAYAFYF